MRSKKIYIFMMIDGKNVVPGAEAVQEVCAAAAPRQGANAVPVLPSLGIPGPSSHQRLTGEPHHLSVTLGLMVQP